jgi:hypothetical protein
MRNEQPRELCQFEDSEGFAAHCELIVGAGTNDTKHQPWDNDRRAGSLLLKAEELVA